MALNVISYGGGVQSSAMVVLAAQGKIKATHALFANTGDDSENPDTLTYVRNVMTPWASERGIEVVELNRRRKTGEVETLHGRLIKEGGRSIPLPFYMSGNGAPGQRACTVDFKIQVIGKWIKAHGASKHDPANVAIGISLDEIQRLGNRKADAWESPYYPLIDLHLTRQDCMNIIANAGLPVPPKSSCYFCPFHRLQVWKEMRRDQPELFNRAVALEELVNGKRDAQGKDPVWLTRTLRPLSQLQEAQPMLFTEETFCDSGYCFT